MPPKRAGGKAETQPVVKKGGAGGSKAYSRPDPIANGEILTDICGKKWKLGKSIGMGGFGEIYLASDETGKPVTDKANYVVKIEPHDNGPLFVEIAVYIRIAKLEMIEEWKKGKKIDSLGMPWYVTSGLHHYKSEKYRFMVIPRFGHDLHKILTEKPGKRFHIKTVQAVALQVIDTLEYIHSRDYIHGDIKASNLLLGFPGSALGSTPPKKQSQQVYLLDYGLASKYKNSDGMHIPYATDLRKAHNGTLEYTSRDAHVGAFSRRGDLEILAYNLLEWTCGKLPWSPTDTPTNVAKQKNAFMSQIKSNGSLRKIYPTLVDVPGMDILESFLKYVAKLDFEEEPDYKMCKDLLRKGLARTNSLHLDEVAVTSPKSKSGASKLKRAASAADALDGVAAPEVVTKKLRVPADDDSLPKKRVTRTTKKVKLNWTRVLSSDPEKIVRSVNGSSAKEATPSPTKSPPILNPTPAMLQILHKRKENMATPIVASASSSRTGSDDGTQRSTRAVKSKKVSSPALVNPTPAMLQVLAKSATKRK